MLGPERNMQSGRRAKCQMRFRTSLGKLSSESGGRLFSVSPVRSDDVVICVVDVV
jgi:hypothetical protein